MRAVTLITQYFQFLEASNVYHGKDFPAIGPSSSPLAFPQTICFAADFTTRDLGRQKRGRNVSAGSLLIFEKPCVGRWTRTSPGIRWNAFSF